MKIFVRLESGKTLDLEVDSQDTVGRVKIYICSQESSLTSQNLELIFAGKKLQDIREFSHYHILEGSTLHALLGAPTGYVAELPTDAKVVEARKEWQAKAEEYDFDDDLHIIDPQSHFHLLRRLERDVVESSEYFRAKRTHDTGSSLHIDLENPEAQTTASEMQDIPIWLRKLIVLAMSQWKTLDSPTALIKMFWHLMKTYCIISRISAMVERLKTERFCAYKVNFLRQLAVDEVIEISTIDIVWIHSLKATIANAARDMLADFKQTVCERKIHEIVNSCEHFIQHVGFKEYLAEDLNPPAMLTFIRKTALLIDSVLVSYVRSHGSGFDEQHFQTELDNMNVSDGDDFFAFECRWKRLACLDAFLDGRKVLVFRLLGKDRRDSKPGLDSKIGSHVLARMQDLADVWGPVYTIPSTDGLISFYAVSKGVICRVKSNSRQQIPGAVQCHYFSRAAFFVQRTRRILPNYEELLLAEDDLLLIGEGLRDNSYCKYSISDFSSDNASKLTVLGTNKSIWKLESRNVAIGLSKYVGVTLSGIQKLIPQKTLKEHVLDKWNTKPTRSNPGIFNQHLGVEVSHCTGNARRISLRKLMTSSPIWAVLERQAPDWTRTSWGESLSQALSAEDNEAIFEIWKTHKTERSNIAELLCCVLDLLDRTGWIDSHSFHAAFLFNNDETAFPVDRELNDWTFILKDTYLTSAYVFINDQCLNCEIPNHTNSLCHKSRGYTVLETEVAAEALSKEREDSTYKMRPSGQHLRQVKGERFDILTLKLASSLSSFAAEPLRRPRSLLELCTRTDRSIDHMVYVRASNKSFHGKHKMQRSIIDKLPVSIPKSVPTPGSERPRKSDNEQDSPRKNILERLTSEQQEPERRKRLSHRDLLPPWLRGKAAAATPMSQLNGQPADLGGLQNKQLGEQQGHAWRNSKQLEIPSPSPDWPTPSKVASGEEDSLVPSDIYGEAFYAPKNAFAMHSSLRPRRGSSVSN